MTIAVNPPVSIEDQEMTERMVRMVNNSIERTKIKGAPVALYDTELHKAYLLYPNGERKYAE